MTNTLADIEQRYRDDPNMYWVTEVEWLLGEVKRLQERAAYAERVWKALGASREQLQAENERLLVDNAELSEECDQWQRKLDEVWAEVAELRAREPNNA